MKVISSNILTELAKEIADIFLLVELQAASTYRWTDRDYSIYTGGNLYEPRDFTFDKLETSIELEVDQVKLTFGAVDQVLTSLVLGEDIRNKLVILSVGALQNNFTILGTSEIFRGFVEGWDLTEDTLEVSVVNELIMWKKKPLRTCQDTCKWTFVTDGSGRCKYNGSATWCDKTWDRCDELSNTDNYGGFRYILDVMEREIWWGRLPKN